MNLIYMTNTTSTPINANGIIPISVNRRKGAVITNNGSSIILKKPGYYKIYATATFNGAAGNAEMYIAKNGIAVDGGNASLTIATANTDLYELTLLGVVRVFCGEAPSIITLVNSGVAITTTNVNLLVEYGD